MIWGRVVEAACLAAVLLAVVASVAIAGGAVLSVLAELL